MQRALLINYLMCKEKFKPEDLDNYYSKIDRKTTNIVFDHSIRDPEIAKDLLTFNSNIGDDKTFFGAYN